jgi:3-methylornithine--L-lysine ligase
MRLAVIGGKLQGTEACYLAGKAGYEVVLVDRKPAPPAAGLADVQHVFDVTEDEERTRKVLRGCDAVLPACEDDATLEWLVEHLPGWDIPLLFDLEAYRVTSSKLRSNELMARLGVPRPRPWPDCGLPAVCKPSGASGSEGVRLATTEAQVAEALDALRRQGHEPVCEEFVRGPSLSLEVVGLGGRQQALLPTALEFDAGYDCLRVTAPVEAPSSLLAGFVESSLQVAQALQLDGVMDVEVMVAGDQAKVIEIDARLPSQTPTAVYHACGVNIVALLAESFKGGVLPAADCSPRRAVVYEHVRAAKGALTVSGEHVIAAARPLHLYLGLFGAYEVLTDRDAGAAAWVATLISRGRDVAEARAAAAGVRAAIAAAHDLEIRAEAGSS